MPKGYPADYRARLLAARPGTKRLRMFFSRVVRDAQTGCWNWIGPMGGGGKNYSFFAYGTGHVVAYRWFVGDIPDGYQIDHLCRNTKCVNPSHIEAVTSQENHRRFEATRTHCKQGHPRDRYWSVPGPNAKRRFGKCRLCSRKWSMNHYNKKKEAA